MLYDLSELKEYSRGDSEFELDMIQTFIDEAAEYKNSIQNSFHNNEISVVATWAHKFKSSVGVFGMIQLRALLDEIEKKCISQACYDDLNNLLGDLDRSVQDLISLMTLEKENY
jgi:HPt (histidine-containing phosphotransfer) domain-containing protein